MAVLGAALNTTLHKRLGAHANAAAALQPQTAGADPIALEHVRMALGAGLHTIFVACVAMGVVALLIALRFPGGSAAEHVHQEGVETASAFGP